MNILHIKYAVEVARQGSFSKAADALLIAQPNISRSIKELEEDLGVTLFSRSAKGVSLTPEGEEFIGYAKGILRQIDAVEELYKSDCRAKQRFSVSAPCSAYVSAAFAEFSCGLTDDCASVSYRETSSYTTINDVVGNTCDLGIVRYAQGNEKLFKALLEEKRLASESVAEFLPVLLMSRENPLAEKADVTSADLASLTEITHSDMLFGLSSGQKAGREAQDKRISVSDRATAYELLSQNTSSFLRTVPLSDIQLEKYGLVQRRCCDDHFVYKDELIYRKGYRLTSLDIGFVTALNRIKVKFKGIK